MSPGRLVRAVTYFLNGDSSCIFYFYDYDRISRTVHNGDTSYYFYDKNGCLSSLTNTNGRTDEFFYNELNQVVKTRVWFLFDSVKIFIITKTKNMK